jgi:hypothetical protein
MKYFRPRQLLIIIDTSLGLHPSHHLASIKAKLRDLKWKSYSPSSLLLEDLGEWERGLLGSSSEDLGPTTVLVRV